MHLVTNTERIMSNAIYNDHVAALSRFGGVVRAFFATRMNPFRLAVVEYQTRNSPRFA